MPNPRALPTLGLATILVVLLAVAAPAIGGSAATPRPAADFATPPASSRALASTAAANNISYNSSVDGFPLSYLEWLPSGYLASQSYPLAVFLHGVGTTTTWVRGGIGGGVDVTDSLVENASAYGFILIAINTRSVEGFYINTPCGGPQQQDVLDAIAHEKALRHISSVYLIGFSMGSLGSFSIAGHNPGMFAGIATAGTISDIYETIAYNTVTNAEPKGLYADLCGGYPSPTNTTIDRVWTSLSVFRFAPQNFSGIPLFVSGGGMDTRAPNNFDEWDYANVNNTFVNSTCHVVAAWGEPANCTVTIPSLAAQDPSAYRWLDLYEPLAPHSTSQLPGAAVFAFFLDEQPGGYYVSTYPGGALTPYTPGTPINLPQGSTGFWGSVELWAVIGVTVAVVAIAAVFVVTRRRPR